MIEAIVFDFDGTLTELRLDFEHVREEVLKVLARHVPAERLDQGNTPFLIELIYELARECEPDAAKVLVQDGFRRLTELECESAQGKDLFPFTREVLGWLKAKGIKIAIISRNCPEALNLVFRDMGDYVETVITRNDTVNVKPHPGQVEKALAELRVVPERALTVGDHPTDIMAGKASGATTIGVLSGITLREAFEQAGADYIAADIRSLPGIVRELNEI